MGPARWASAKPCASAFRLLGVGPSADPPTPTASTTGQTQILAGSGALAVAQGRACYTRAAGVVLDGAGLPSDQVRGHRRRRRETQRPRDKGPTVALDAETTMARNWRARSSAGPRRQEGAGPRRPRDGRCSELSTDFFVIVTGRHPPVRPGPSPRASSSSCVPGHRPLGLRASAKGEWISSLSRRGRGMCFNPRGARLLTAWRPSGETCPRLELPRRGLTVPAPNPGPEIVNRLGGSLHAKVICCTARGVVPVAWPWRPWPQDLRPPLIGRAKRARSAGLINPPRPGGVWPGCVSTRRSTGRSVAFALDVVAPAVSSSLDRWRQLLRAPCSRRLRAQRLQFMGGCPR